MPAGTRGLVVQDLDLDFDESRTAAPSRDATTGEEPTAEEDCLSADVDILAFGDFGVRAFRNVLNADSKARTLEAVEQSFGEVSAVSAAAAADVDGDGDLDVTLASPTGLSVWSNRGNGTFADITSRSKFDEVTDPAIAIVPVDLDRDLDIDFVAASNSRVAWLENLRHGRLRERAFDGTLSELDNVAAVDVMDADNDGLWDLVVADSSGIHLIRTSSRGDGSGLRDVMSTAISDTAVKQIQTFDYDNDGISDLVACDGESPVVYRGLSGGRFEERAVDLSSATMARSCQVGDLDSDGDLDLCVIGGAGPVFFQNDGGNQNGWLDVGLKARQIKGGQSSASGRVNAYGVGSSLDLKAGVAFQAQMVRGQSTHFGLGQQSQADIVRVLWLNGVPQNLIQPSTNRTVCEQQVLTGSCPYLYAWNGESFRFVTDLLWAAPLGLQVADGAAHLPRMGVSQDIKRPACAAKWRLRFADHGGVVGDSVFRSGETNRSRSPGRRCDLFQRESRIG